MSLTPTLATALARLLELSRRGARLGLDRIEEALGFCGDPQRDLAIVHIGGTNGKGSTAAMIEAIARRAGVRTGLYTSPHLCRYNERIRIDGEPIDDGAFASVLERALHRELPPLSFFETLTVAAFLAFARARVDLVVLEVGLGGRLDATNVISEPLCAAITSIGYDHQRFLGDDLAAIAREKAAIAKPGRPLVVAPLAPEAAAATAQVAQATGASPLVWLAPRGASIPAARQCDTVLRVADEEQGGTRIHLGDGVSLKLHPRLLGRHQRMNAAVAAATAWQLREAVAGIDAHIEGGIAEAQWPGRLEQVPANGVQVLLDCAHNIDGMASLCEALRDGLVDGAPPERTILVFGAIDDKPHAAMLDAIAPLAARRHYCQPIDPIAGRRSVDPRELSRAWPGSAHDRPEQALAAALAEATRGDRVVVTGSIFLVGAARAELLGLERHPTVPL